MKPRVLFLSASEIAIPCLEALLSLYKEEQCSWLGIVTHAARPRGRGQQCQLNTVAAWAVQNNFDCYPTEKMDAAAFAWCQKAHADIIFVMAFGHILKPKFLQLAPLGVWNFHTSLLPKYRGASPIKSCLLAGDHETGVTLMQVVEQLDAGPWIAQARVSINSQETNCSLSQKLAQTSAQLLKENWLSIAQKNYTLTPQKESEATFTHKFRKEDGLLNGQEPATALERKIRAFNPWPGTFFRLKDLDIKVHAAHVLESSQSTGPDHLIVNSGICYLGLSTIEGVLVFDKVQRPGGKILNAREFVNGSQKFLKDFLQKIP